MIGAPKPGPPPFRSLVESELFKIRSQTVNRRLALAPVLCMVVYAAFCALSHGPTRGRVLQGALDLIAARRVDVTHLVTHRFGLTEVGEAFRIVAEGADSLKVLLNPHP